MSNSDAHPDIVMHVPDDTRTNAERRPAAGKTAASAYRFDRSHWPSPSKHDPWPNLFYDDSQITQKLDQLSHEVALLKKQLSDATAAAAAKDGQLLELEERVLQLEGRRLQKDVEVGPLENSLPTRGGSSDAGVADHLDRINNLVEEFAISTSVSLTDSKYQPSNRRVEIAYRTIARDILGTPMVQALHDAAPDFEFAPLLLQFALQSTILHGMADILHRFAFYTPNVPDASEGSLDNKFYMSLGSEILKGELQSSFGNWRSLTHQYLRKSYATENLQKLVDEFVARRQKECYQLSLILFKDASPSPEVFYKESLVPVKEIVEETLRLAIEIRENVITRNYEAYLPKYKTPFSNGSMEAEDGDAYPDRTQHDRVVCVTALGLSYSTKSGREGELGQTIFKKAKVLTQDVLAEFSPSD